MAKKEKSDSVSKQKKSTTNKKKVKEEEEVDEEPLSDPDNDLLDQKPFKNGQKYPTPPIGDGTRAFYESLLEENPKSHIAIKFCVEHGILRDDEHDKLHGLYTKLRDSGMFKAPSGGLTLDNNAIV